MPTRLDAVNAADLLIDAVAARPGTADSDTAVHWVDRDRALTYKEAVDAMARAAAVLDGFGVPAGGRVGLFAHPGLDYVVALLGAWRLGATAVLVDLADKDRFHELMTAAAPHAVVYTNDHFDYVQPTLAALGATGPAASSAATGPAVSGPAAVRSSSGPGSHARPTVFAGMDGPQPGTVCWLDALAEATPLAESSLSAAGAESSLSAAGAESSLSVAGAERSLSVAGAERSLSVAGAERSLPVAGAEPSLSAATDTAATAAANATAANAIALTAPASATTRTHAELIEAAAAVAARLDLNPDDATLCPTPLAQPFHLEASILPALLRGATAGLLKSWQPDDAWEQMERNGTTVLCGTPEHCEQLLEASAARGRKPASLRAAVTTATTPDTDDLADRLRTQLDVHLLVTPSPSH